MKVAILKVSTDALSFDEAVSTLMEWASTGGGQPCRYVSTCPVYTLMQCTERPEVMEAVNGADMVTADGMPVVWVQRWRGVQSAERVYGPDLMQEICRRSVQTGVQHYLWGGLDSVAEELKIKLENWYPGLQIAGCMSPPVAPVGQAPDPEVVKKLNESGAQIIWVGLGSPKQDQWMRLYRPVLKARILIGVGAAFDMHAGRIRQAPRWMQRTGLEWLFRLCLEPRRLARRYLVYNPLFVWGILREGKRPKSAV